MDKRIRSPNYPAISLAEAVSRVGTLYKTLHTHAAPREVIAKGMGFNSLNGASATAISALHKYGLLERSGDDIKVSERALSILHPHDDAERSAAIKAAAYEPSLFAELAERFPGAMPNEDLLRNYLVRKGFAPGALGQVISAYRETSEMVGGAGGGYDSARSPGTEEPTKMLQIPHHGAQGANKTVIIQEDGRLLGRYDFEGGGFVKILAGGEIETEEALEMVQTLIDLKRKELERSKGKNTSRVGGDDDFQPE